MESLRTGARLLSRGMRGGNTALTLVGAVLTARAIATWLDRPRRELIYSQKLAKGETVRIAMTGPSVSGS